MIAYRIDAIGDLVKIPPDRVEACLRDIAYAVAVHHLAFGTGSDCVPFGALEWTDDDNHSVRVYDARGAKFLELKVEDEQEGEG